LLAAAPAGLQLTAAHDADAADLKIGLCQVERRAHLDLLAPAVDPCLQSGSARFPAKVMESGVSPSDFRSKPEAFVLKRAYRQCGARGLQTAMTAQQTIP
jgi:hypothetical protein